jgi:ABC-type antimicrobial peptide transport system permease subunit
MCKYRYIDKEEAFLDKKNKENVMKTVEVLNPLYVKKAPTKTSIKKQVVTARIENTKPGICPKCNSQMSHANLGQCMANQIVYFCPVCRVAEPMPI